MADTTETPVDPLDDMFDEAPAENVGVGALDSTTWAEQEEAEGKDPSASFEDLDDSEQTEVPEKQEETGDSEQSITLNIDGKDHSFSTEDAKAFIEAGFKAEEMVQEAQHLKEGVFDLIRLFKESPEEVFAHPAVGVNAREWAEKYLMHCINQEAEDLSLSPAEKELKEIKFKEANKSKFAEKERAEREKQEDMQVAKEFEQREMQFFETKLVPAFVGSGLPQTPELLAKAADLRSRTLDRGLDLAPAVIVQKVREQYLGEMRQVLEGLDSNALYELLGDKTASKFRQADIAKFKNKALVPNPAHKPVETQPSKSTKSKQPVKKDSYKDFWKGLNKQAAKKK